MLPAVVRPVPFPVSEMGGGRSVSGRLMIGLARAMVARPWWVVIFWLLVLATASPFALHLGRVAQGGSEAIRGSESHAVMETLNREFGRGFSHVVPVVITSEQILTSDPRFAQMIADLTVRLGTDASVRGIVHAWNSGQTELLGRDGRSALVLVRPGVGTLIEAERFVGTLRARLAGDRLPAGFAAHVTGMSAMFHDLNRRSSADLLRAEAVGVPLTLIVLFLVFRTALAAGLALAVAASAVLLSSAALCLANSWLPASQLAQNVVTMIGLGAGTDYALFVLSHYREERSRGAGLDDAIVGAIHHAGPAVLVAGLAVAGGFGALFIVNARFVHSLALGGISVIAGALAATLTLLPALLKLFRDRVVRPAAADAVAKSWRTRGWLRWTNAVMRRPWAGLGLAVAVTALWGWPAWRTQAWRIGPPDLPVEEESRRGYDLLTAQFQPGWMGPVALSLEAKPGQTLWDPANQRAVLALAAELRANADIAHVIGFPRLLEALGPARELIRSNAGLPGSFAEFARSAVSADGRTAVVIAVPRVVIEAARAVELIRKLREQSEFDAKTVGFRFKVGGGTAIVHDFDLEMFRSVGRVMGFVVVLTFVLLLFYFRSIAVPLKAIAANLLSVVAAYGFLVLLFQDGIGAQLLGIHAPGGLNSFVVLMLFTILFGLSMDYEIFLLSRIRDEWRASADADGSVAVGLASTAGIITSAAAVMVCLFGSFGFFGLTASRQFGLGLAFAVAFDATIVRLLIVPAAMRLLGRWNWWLPGSRV